MKKRIIFSKDKMEQKKEEAIDILLELLENADYKVYTALGHRSYTGMYRLIKLYVAVDSEIKDITYHTGILIGGLLLKDNNYYIERRGFGSDVEYDIVYDLSYRLYGDGYKLERIRL